MAKKEIPYIRCPKCNGKWFDSVEASTFRSDQTLILGQKPMSSTVFYILKCLKCGELTEPFIMQNQSSPMYQDHTEFIREMEETKKNDQTEK